MSDLAVPYNPSAIRTGRCIDLGEQYLTLRAGYADNLPLKELRDSSTHIGLLLCTIQGLLTASIVLNSYVHVSMTETGSYMFERLPFDIKAISD